MYRDYYENHLLEKQEIWKNKIEDLEEESRQEIIKIKKENIEKNNFLQTKLITEKDALEASFQLRLKEKECSLHNKFEEKSFILENLLTEAKKFSKEK